MWRREESWPSRLYTDCTLSRSILVKLLILFTISFKGFGVPVVSSTTGAEFINDGSWDTVFVLEDFNGPVYDAIHRSEQRLVHYIFHQVPITSANSNRIDNNLD
jgi:hypothetical protein